MGNEPRVMDPAWDVVLAISALAEDLERKGLTAAFGLDEHEQLQPVAADTPDAAIFWSPDSG